MKVPKNYRLEKKLVERLKEHSKKSNINATRIIELALEKYLNKEFEK